MKKNLMHSQNVFLTFFPMFVCFSLVHINMMVSLSVLLLRCYFPLSSGSTNPPSSRPRRGGKRPKPIPSALFRDETASDRFYIGGRHEQTQTGKLNHV